jgi:hypothetical protein
MLGYLSIFFDGRDVAAWLGGLLIEAPEKNMG